MGSRRTWTEDRIIEAVHRSYREHGRLPSVEDWKRGSSSNPTWQTVYKYFAGPADLFAKAGLAHAHNAKPQWDAASMVQAAHDFRTEFGRWPRGNDWRKAAPAHPSVSTIRNHFPGWPEFIEACGAEYTPPVKEVVWTYQRSIEAARAWERDRGSAPTRSDWILSGPDRPTVSTIYKLFSTWYQFIEAAGLEYNSKNMQLWNRNTIIQALISWAAIHGAWPASRDWKSSGSYHPQLASVYKIFGSWPNAIKAAKEVSDISYPDATARKRTTSRSWSYTQILRVARQWKKQTGSWPTLKEWENDSENWPTGYWVRREFGSWQNMIEILDPERKNRPAKGRSRHIPERVRAEVYAKHGKVCSVPTCHGLCSDDITLDHIVAFKHGGSNEAHNLEPKCRSCNSSKNALTEDEFERKVQRRAAAEAVACAA